MRPLPPQAGTAEGAMATPTEMREQSRWYRDAARNESDILIKRQLAARAFDLAQLAEHTEREEARIAHLKSKYG